LTRYRNLALVAGVGGLAATALGFAVDQQQFFRSYLWAWWFWTGIGLGCLQMFLLYNLTGGKWGLTAHRVLEAAALTVPPMLVAVLPLLFGIQSLFGWARGDVAHKAAYLNVPFFLIRGAIYFAVWTLLVFARRRTAVAGPGIFITTLAVSFAAIDWGMSLEPEWFSTIYPLLHAVGQVLSGLALSILVLALFAGKLNIAADRDVFHDLGNLLFTFTVLWAYIQFSQLLIIWSGNLPAEIIWYRHRFAGGWQYVAWFLVVFHFLVPFAVLLSRRTKRRRHVLAAVAAFILLMRLVDYVWLYEPAFNPGRIVVHWLDIAAPLGIGGLWLALFFGRLTSREAAA
jgi:hypothetical protein